jgi:predicted nuclease of predicted toxin-antitoxin system
VKFLVDAQLPARLSHFLNTKGHDSLHTLDLPNQNSTKDTEVIQVATRENRVVITKDSDFLDSFLINALPEKLIIVKTGNISNQLLIQIFEKHLPLIVEMISRSNLVEINSDQIAEHGQNK